VLNFLIKIAVYLLVGFGLVTACIVYVRSAWETFFGTPEIVIAPFEVVGADKERGTALAHMLQARIREIERDIDNSQRSLIALASPASISSEPRSDAGPPGTQTAPPVAPRKAAAMEPFGVSMPWAITQPVGLQAGLVEPGDIPKVSVGGVEIGGILAWLQRRLDQRKTLTLTYYEKKHDVVVTGSLEALGVRDDSLRIEVPGEDIDGPVALDQVVERVAYEIVGRRLAADPNNRVAALSGEEFQTLVEVMRDAARLNRQVMLRRGALPQFKELMPRASKLAREVPEWPQLNYLAASVAESAKQPREAVYFYTQVQTVLARDGSGPPPVATIVKQRIEALTQDIELEEHPSPASGLAPTDAEAMAIIGGFVRAATIYLNGLYEQSFAPPPVELQTDHDLMTSSYWDGAKVVVPAMVRYLPDIAYHEASWQHITEITGTAFLSDDGSPASAIAYSFADILTALVQQHERREDAKTSAWLLFPGGVEWQNGEDLAAVRSRTPLRSFRQPGDAYKGDSQVAHMLNYVSNKGVVGRSLNGGILNKAFYETATRLSSERAATIWAAALRDLRRLKKVDFYAFARFLHERAGADKESVRQSLALVGLDPTRPRGAD
jgi:hypothetical protein